MQSIIVVQRLFVQIPIGFRVFPGVQVPFQEGRLLWHIFASLQQQVDVLIQRKVTSVQLVRLKVADHLVITVFRDKFSHSQVC